MSKNKKVQKSKAWEVLILLEGDQQWYCDYVCDSLLSAHIHINSENLGSGYDGRVAEVKIVKETTKRKEIARFVDWEIQIETFIKNFTLE